jgi:hypothetical protein
MSELFAFEVPTTAGIIRIVSPVALTRREALKAAATIRRVLRVAVIPPVRP